MADPPGPEGLERWELLQRLEPLLLQKLEPSTFEDELRRICGDDPLLRAQAEELLRAADRSSLLFDQGAFALAEPFLRDLEGPGAESGFTVPQRLGPYRILGEIGAGGMSRVYLGERDDGELSLRVAIKVMHTGRSHRAEYEQRFRAERQILASFDHGNIARVFDGGVTEGGLPYLVMEHVSGKPLTTYCEHHRLSLVRRLELVAEICGAVQYAHQRLVVHRDLKPSNILVTEDGRVKLLDFGIAKWLDSAAEMPVTRTGLLLLTPEYAAPEQLKGREVTTAVDIYALGVLLYELLTGSRPERSTAAEAQDLPLKNPSLALAEAAAGSEAGAGSEAHRTPITWSAELRGDLDTVVQKALRPEPHGRYGSARELAEELRRFIAGEPVLARPIGPMERALRFVRRRRRTVGVFCLLLMMAGTVLYLMFSSRREARAAQRFGQEVERIEAMVQRAHMAPRHDIRPELEAVRARMEEIHRQLAGVGRASQASAFYALGRGYLDLGELELARTYLQRAWDGSQQDTRSAYALGLTLSRLYRLSLEELSQIRSPEVRELRRAEIEREFLEPAVRALEAVGTATSHGELVAASLDFFAGRAEQALERLEKRSRHEPWFYEPELLAGDIYSELQRSASESGQTKDADQAQQRAAEAYGRAIEVARSDPRGYEGLCNLWSSVLLQRYYTSKEDLVELRRQALAACSQAGEVNPDRGQGHLRLGRVERMWAEYLMEKGEDPRALLEAAEGHLKKATRLAPRNPEPWVVRGAGSRTLATFLDQRGEDPTEAYGAALASYDRAIELKPDLYGAHLSRSLAELHLGDFERRRGGAADARFEGAIASARRAVEIHPEVASGHLNLGIAYGQLAIMRRDRSAPAMDVFNQGIAALNRALEINPLFLIAHFNLGHVLIQRGELELGLGQDPAASIESAKERLSHVQEPWSEFAPVLIMQAQAESLAARQAMAQGKDPEALIAAAKSWARRSVEIKTAEPDIYAEAARIHLLEARRLLDIGGSAEPAATRALGLLERALAMDDRRAKAFRLVAEAHWLRALDLAGQSKDPRPVLRAGLKAAHRAIDENPNDSDNHLQVARLELLSAEFPDQEPPADRREAARQAAERALELRPGYSEVVKLLRSLEG